MYGVARSLNESRLEKGGTRASGCEQTLFGLRGSARTALMIVLSSRRRGGVCGGVAWFWLCEVGWVGSSGVELGRVGLGSVWWSAVGLVWVCVVVRTSFPKPNFQLPEVRSWKLKVERSGLKK